MIIFNGIIPILSFITACVGYANLTECTTDCPRGFYIMYLAETFTLMATGLILTAISCKRHIGMFKRGALKPEKTLNLVYNRDPFR